MMMIAHYIVIAIFVIILSYILNKIYQIIKFNYEIYPLLKEIPGPDFPIWPFSSKYIQTLMYSKNPFNDFFTIINNLADKYESNGIFCFARGPVAQIIITDPIMAQKILSSEDFKDKSTQYRIMRFAILDNIFTCNRNTLRQHKRELLPFFRLQPLIQYLKNSKKYINLIIDNIEHCIDYNDGKFNDFKSIVDSYMADTLGINFFNTEFNSIKSGFKINRTIELIDELIHYMSKYLSHPLVYLPRLKYLSFDKILSKIFLNSLNEYNNIVNNIIMESVKKNLKKNQYCHYDKDKNNNYIDNDKKNGDNMICLLDAIIQSRMNQNQDEKIMNFDEIRGHMNILLFAGFDTSKTTLSWCFYLLGHHQQVQHCLYQEIKQYLLELDENNEEINITNMKRLKFVECCIYETLRLYPPGPLIGRKSRKIFQLTDRIRIPPKTNVLINIWKMGRNPKYFKEPDKFIPERFLNYNNDNDQQLSLRSAFFPFSGGIRPCLGREYAMIQMRLFIINIINRYQVYSLDRCYGELKPELNFIHPAASFPVQFKRRNNIKL